GQGVAPLGGPHLILHGQEESRGTGKRSIALFRGMRTHLTIVGGGLAGLVAAITAREAGLDVTVHEMRKELGGRARTTDGAPRANWGVHVVYSDGPLWAWLNERGLARPSRRVPTFPRPAFRVDGRPRTLPPL